LKKIVFIVDSFPSYSETFLYNQIYYLLDQGYHVEILAIKSKDRFAKSIHQKMYEYDLWGKCSFLRYNFGFGILKNLLFHPILSLRILKIWSIKRGIFLIRNLDLLLSYSNYDVIHAHYGHVAALACDLKSIGLYRNVRIVCSFHGEDVSHNLPNTHAKKYYNIGRLADVVTVNSIYTYNCLLKSVGETWHNIKIVPVPVDSNYFKPSSILKKQREFFKIVFCGRLIEWKAPRLAIQIVLELIELNYPVKLDIIGDGPEYQACAALISKNGLDDSVKLLGALSQEEILINFDEADVFLFPSIRESTTLKTEAQGLVLQEAQAMRLPVVISDVGGMKYGMKDGITGIVVEEHNVAGFVFKLRELIENPSLIKSMGDAAREYVANNFDVEVVGKKMLELYGFNNIGTHA
tara:strand:- start:4894 stop:6114 length:1221 start_codon:yes stop_codon:yes gene_type:complete